MKIEIEIRNGMSGARRWVRPRVQGLFTVLLASGIAGSAFQAEALAAEVYPQRAIRLIIPYPPGGAGDIVGRMLSARLMVWCRVWVRIGRSSACFPKRTGRML